MEQQERIVVRRARQSFGIVWARVLTDPRLDVYASTVYAVLATYCGREREAYPSLETLARESHQSRNRVKESLTLLEALGYLSRRKKAVAAGWVWLWSLDDEPVEGGSPGDGEGVTGRPPGGSQGDPDQYHLTSTNDQDSRGAPVGLPPDDEKVDSEGRPKHIPQKIVEEVIKYLNDSTGARFDPKSKATYRLLDARWQEGHTGPDFADVIDNKVRDWLPDKAMAKYLRPSTLFRASHFEEYLNG